MAESSVVPSAASIVLPDGMIVTSDILPSPALLAAERDGLVN
jgi:hypothetical protein